MIVNQEKEKKMKTPKSLMSGKLKLVASLALAVAALVGCAKQRPQVVRVDPNAYVAKSDLDGKSFYLVRGIEEADSNNSVRAIPGFSQQFGIVKVRITETTLQFVREHAPLEREATAAIVAAFPIKDHFDIIQEENDFKEKTHRIVEDRQKPWNQRAFIRVDWTSPSNELGKLTSRLSRDTQEEVRTLLENPKIENGHVSWLVESTVKGPDMIRFIPPFVFEPLDSFRVTYRTHLMPVKPSDHRAVNYSLKDLSRFGAFVEQLNVEDPEKGLRDNQQKLLANVFNVCEAGGKGSCSTNKVRWVLSKGFPSEYLEETRKAVREWNEAFREALGRTDDVVILEEKEVDISDPRYNIIAYYEPKSPGGLLGVAQWTADPRTGETVGARASVYGDGIRHVTGRIDTMIDLIASDDALREIIGVDESGNPVQPSPIRAPEAGSEMIASWLAGRQALGLDAIGSADSIRDPAAQARLAASRAKASPEKAEARLVRMMNPSTSGAHTLFVPDALTQTPGLGALARSSVRDSGVPSLNGLEKLISARALSEADKRQRIRDGLEGIHGVDMVDEAVTKFLLRLAETTTPRELVAKKAEIKKRVAKLTYYSTLLHEMGHTFGLLHNFAASADRAHYHDDWHKGHERILKGEQGISRADLAGLASSSVMDYVDFFQEIPGLGKYDKAAVRYLYNRSIDRETDPKTTAAKFLYCSDWQVGEDLLCNRFDTGSNVSEITMNRIERFHRNWALSHFRRDKTMFDEDWSSVVFGAIEGTFVPVRQVFDEFLYKLVTDQPGSTCSTRFQQVSVDLGEIANVCNSVQAEAAGVDPTDMSTMARGLVDRKTGRMMVNRATGRPFDFRDYTPGGLADMLYATVQAQTFFQEILGSTEPGSFVVMPSQTEGEAPILERLPNFGNDEEKLAAFAEDNEERVGDTEAFVKEAKGRIVHLGIGRMAKPFESRSIEIAGHSQMQNIGAFWDKYAALISLSRRNIGVAKYSRAQLTGNAYTYPQTKKFATQLFSRLITNQNEITRMPVPIVLDGKPVVIRATVPATLSKDTQSVAVGLALALNVSDDDDSFLGKLRICVKGDPTCTDALGAESVEIVTPRGETLRAYQTTAGDSISFALLSMLKDESKDLVGLHDMNKKARSGEIKAENLKKLDNAKKLRERIDQNLRKVTELAPLADQVTAVGPEAKSLWMDIQKFNDEVQSSQIFTGRQQAQALFRSLTQAEAQVAKALEEMGETGKCHPKAGKRTRNRRGPRATEESLGKTIPKCGNSPEAERRHALEQLKSDFETVKNVIADVLISNLDGRIAERRLEGVNQGLTSRLSILNAIRGFGQQL